MITARPDGGEGISQAQAAVPSEAEFTLGLNRRTLYCAPKMIDDTSVSLAVGPSRMVLLFGLYRARPFVREGCS